MLSICLRQVTRPLRIVLCKENPYYLISVLGPFQVILQPWSFVKLNLPILLVLARQREKSSKYVNVSASTSKLTRSNLRSKLIKLFKWCYEFNMSKNLTLRYSKWVRWMRASKKHFLIYARHLLQRNWFFPLIALWYTFPNGTISSLE